VEAEAVGARGAKVEAAPTPPAAVCVRATPTACSMSMPVAAVFAWPRRIPFRRQLRAARSAARPRRACASRGTAAKGASPRVRAVMCLAMVAVATSCAAGSARLSARAATVLAARRPSRSGDCPCARSRHEGAVSVPVSVAEHPGARDSCCRGRRDRMQQLWRAVGWIGRRRSRRRIRKRRTGRRPRRHRWRLRRVPSRVRLPRRRLSAVRGVPDLLPVHGRARRQRRRRFGRRRGGRRERRSRRCGWRRRTRRHDRLRRDDGHGRRRRHDDAGTYGVRHDDLRRGHAGLLHLGNVARDVRSQRLLHLRSALVLQQRELRRRSSLLRDSRQRWSPDGRLRRRSLSVLPTLHAPRRMHRGEPMHGHDLSGQPCGLRQVRGSQLQHQSALLPQHGHVLPGGLGILLPLSAGTMKTSTHLARTLALTVTLAVLACSGSSSSGGDGGGGATGGSAAGGSGGSAPDGGTCPWTPTPCAQCDTGLSCCGGACCGPGEWCDASGGTPTCRCGSGAACPGGISGTCTGHALSPTSCDRFCCVANCF
jgi:hypothetical protein